MFGSRRDIQATETASQEEGARWQDNVSQQGHGVLPIERVAEMLSLLEEFGK